MVAHFTMRTYGAIRQSRQIRFFSRKDPAYVRNMFLATILYKYHDKNGQDFMGMYHAVCKYCKESLTYDLSRYLSLIFNH